MNSIATDSDHVPVICVQYCGDKTDATYSTDKAYCIPKNPVSDRQQAVCMPVKNVIAYPVHNHPQDSRVTIEEDITTVQTLNAKMGTGGG